MSVVQLPEQMCNVNQGPWGAFLGPSRSPEWFRSLRPEQFVFSEQGQQWLAWRRSGWGLGDIAAEANKDRLPSRPLYNLEMIEVFFDLAERAGTI